MNKKNDMFAVLFYQPDASVNDLALNGITPDNTGIQDRDYYKNLKSVQDADQFKTDGKFDETKFNNFYDSVTRVYNTYAKEDWQKQIYESFAKDPYDWTDPFNSNVKDFNVTVDNSNRGRTSFGITGFNRTGDPTLSTREIAQASKMHDKDGNELDFSPNSRGFFKSIFAPTAALAQYDETGMYDENGKQVMHYKGEYKLNADGDPYYEELGDKNPYGREILRVSDVVTVDGTTLNKYFDIFDADGIDENVGKTILKTTAKIAPLLIPGAGQVYGVIGMVAGLAESLPGLVNSVNSIFGVQDTEYGKAIARADAYMSRFKETTSDNSKGKFWTFENFGNIITSSAGQLFSQRTVANLSQALITGGDLLQARKIGQKLSLGYMALTSSTDAYADFKAAGASDRVAGIGALATMAGLYTLMSKDYFKDWLFKGQWLDENEGKNVVANFMKEKSQLYTKELLGEEALKNAEKLSTKEAASLFGKVKNGAIKIWDKFAKTPLSGKVPELTTATSKGAEAVVKKTAGKKVLSIFNIMLNRSVNEGVEETMEEVVQDLTKGIFAGCEALGFDMHDEKEDELNFGWSLGDAMLRYLTSFAGGFFGGAVFEGITQLEYARDHKIQLSDLEDVDSQLMYMLLQGRKNDLLEYAKLYKEKNAFLSKDLSMRVVQRNSDGELVYAPTTDANKSQNEEMYNFVVGEINRMDKLLSDSGFTSAALTRYLMEFDQGVDKDKDTDINIINAVKKLKVHTSFMDDMIKTGKELITVNDAIQSIEPVLTDPEKRKIREEKKDLPADRTKENLLERKKELEKKRDELFDHKNDFKYIRQALFMLDVPLQKLLLGCVSDDKGQFENFNEENYVLSGNQGFDNYLYLQYGKVRKNLSSEELTIYKKDYDAFKEMDKEHIAIDLSRKLFDLSCAINETFANPLNNAENYLKDTVDNDVFERTVLLGNTKVFEKYQMAKASIPLYDTNIKKEQQILDEATKELKDLDGSDPANEAKINELNATIAQSQAKIDNLQKAKLDLVEDINEFEAIYGDDERTMPFLGISLAVDENGKKIDDEISEEQRQYAKFLQSLDSNILDDIKTLFDDANEHENNMDEEGFVDEELVKQSKEEYSKADVLHTDYISKLQTAIKFVIDYYNKVNNKNMLNTSDLYLTALTRNIAKILNSDAFKQFSELQAEDDGSFTFKHIFNGETSASGETKYKTITIGNNRAIVSTLTESVKRLSESLMKYDYNEVQNIKSWALNELTKAGIEESDAENLIKDYFETTLGVDIFSIFNDINNKRKSAKSFDIVDVIKNLSLSTDGELYSLLDLLKEEKNAIAQKGATLQDYIMDPTHKETLNKVKSLMTIALTAIQAASDGSNKVGNSMIKSADVAKYGEITERTKDALIQDLYYYLNAINYLLNLSEENEKTRSDYYQKCEVGIHRNVLSQLINDFDKESSWGNKFYKIFGVNIPELLTDAFAETGCNVTLNTLNQKNFSEFKPAFIRLFSKIRSEILNSSEFKALKDTDYKDKSDEYIIGSEIAKMVSDKNPKLGNYGEVNIDDPLTDLSMATYLVSLLSEDYESFYNDFMDVVGEQDKYAPFAAQELAVLTSYEFAIDDKGAFTGFLDILENSKINLDGIDLLVKEDLEKKEIIDAWNKRKTLRNFILTQGGTGSGKTSACAFFVKGLLKKKFGDDIAIASAAPDMIQATHFNEILGEGKTLDFASLLKSMFGGKEDISGLLNLDMTGDASKIFFEQDSDNEAILKNIMIAKKLDGVFDKKSKHQFIFIDEVSHLNRGTLEFINQVADKFGIKILAYGDPMQNGATYTFTKNGKKTTADYNISDFFTISTPSLGDSVRFENSAKDKNYRTIKTVLNQIEKTLKQHAVLHNDIIKKVSEQFKQNLPMDLKIDYYEDDNNFVGEKFIKETEVNTYIDKFKKLSLELHKDDPDTSKRIPNICIITDDTTKYTAEPGVTVINPKSVQGLEFDYVIIAGHKFDSDFYTAIKDLYTLTGRSKKGTVIDAAASKFKITNVAGNDSLLAPRNTNDEIDTFKTWKNNVFEEIKKKLNPVAPSAPLAAPPTTPSGSGKPISPTVPPGGKPEPPAPAPGSEPEGKFEEETPEDDRDDGESEYEKDGNGNGSEFDITTIAEDDKKSARTKIFEINSKQYDLITSSVKYSWANYVSWVNSENGLFLNEGYTGKEIKNRFSIFNGLEFDKASSEVVSDLKSFYRKFASAVVYNAELNMNQYNAMLKLVPNDHYKNIAEQLIRNWNSEMSDGHTFIARPDKSANKTLISYVLNAEVDGKPTTYLIPVALIDGIAEGTITTKTALFKRESEMNVIFDVPNKRYSVYGQDEEATGTISKPKILTLDRYSKNYDTGVNAFAKENSGAAIALVTDAEFLTDADFDQMFRTRKDGERVKQALNFDEIVSTKEGRKNTNVYYLTMNGTQIPFMNVPVRNEVSLGELYNLSRIGLYACGSLEEKYLNQTQKDLITSEGVGISVENAMRYMKRYIGQFDVGKTTNAAGDRTAMLSKIFRRLSSSYKLLGRADSFNFAGMLYAAVNQIKKDSDAETTALISYAKTKFNSSLLKYLAWPSSQNKKYAYKNAITFNIGIPYTKTAADGSTRTYIHNTYYTAQIEYDGSKYNAKIRRQYMKGVNFAGMANGADPNDSFVIPALNTDMTVAVEKMLMECVSRAVASVPNSRPDIKNGANVFLSEVNESNIIEKLSNGSIQMFLTSISQKIQEDGSLGEPKVNMLNDYQMVSKLLDGIPDTNSKYPETLSLVAKQLYNFGHFKDGFILNANRIVSEENEEKRQKTNYADTPFLPNITKTNFIGATSRNYTLNQKFSGTVDTTFGDFQYGVANTNTTTSFVIDGKYDIQDNCVMGWFKVDSEWIDENLVDAPKNRKNATVFKINFSGDSVTSVVLRVGSTDIEVKVKAGTTLAQLTNGQIVVNPKLSANTGKPEITDILGNVYQLDDKEEGVGYTSIIKNGKRYMIISNKLGVICAVGNKEMINITLDLKKINYSIFQGSIFQKSVWTKGWKPILYEEDGNVVYDYQTDQSGYLDSSHKFAIFVDENGVETKVPVMENDSVSNITLVEHNGVYTPFGRNKITQFELFAITDEYDGSIEDTDNFILNSISGNEITVTNPKTEETKTFHIYGGNFDVIKTNFHIKTEADAKMDRLKQLCENKFKTNKLVETTPEKMLDELNGLLTKERVQLNEDGTDFEFVNTEQDLDISIIEASGYKAVPYNEGQMFNSYEVSGGKIINVYNIIDSEGNSKSALVINGVLKIVPNINDAILAVNEFTKSVSDCLTNDQGEAINPMTETVKENLMEDCRKAIDNPFNYGFSILYDRLQQMKMDCRKLKGTIDDAKWQILKTAILGFERGSLIMFSEYNDAVNKIDQCEK